MKIYRKLILLVCAVLSAAAFYLYRDHVRVTKLNEFKNNIAEIEQTSKKNIAEVEDKIKESRKKNGIKPVTISNKIAFEDSVFIGDSITEPLANYEFLSQSNVLAKVGVNLRNADSLISNLENLNPGRVFLLFGLNDIINTENTDEFIKNYDGFINKIRSKVPTAKIYIISILPVKSFVSSKNSKLTDTNILLYNNALIEFAKSKKYTFIDVRKVAQDNQNLYEPDGEHFKKPFYALYLEEIKQILAQEKE